MSHSSMRDWSVADVCGWLETLRGKLGHKTDSYIKLFQEEDVDGEVLVDVSEQGLLQLGVASFGHRHYLLKVIAQMTGGGGGAASGSSAGTGSSSSYGVGSTGVGAGSAGNSRVGSMHVDALDMHANASRLPLASPVAAHGAAGHMHGAAGHMPPPSIPMHRPGAGVPVTAGLGGVAHARYGFPGRGPAVPVSAPPAAYMSNFVFHDYNKGANSMTRAAIPRLHNATPRIHESKVIIGRKIGSGSVGNVYAGTFEEHPVAIKQHKMDGGPPDAKALQEFEIEVGKMTAVNHPCIVRCYGMLEPTPGIVLELVNGGSLFHILHAKRDESFQSYQLRLPWPVRMRYMLDSLYGLRAVHSAGMIHGDFKTLNMLVGPDHRVKVADFGLSKCIGTLTVIPGTKTITGTPQYMAPEIMQSLPQSMRVDMYSVGIVMWEVLTGQIPWFGMDIVQIIQQVTLKANETQFPPPGRPPLQNHHVRSAPVGYVKLMQEAWSQHPNDRPTTDTCVQVLESIHQSHGMYPFRENQEGPLQYQMPAHTPQLSLPLQNAAGPAVHRGKTPRISTLDIPPSSSAVPAGTLTNIPAHFNALLEAPLGAPVATSNQWKPPEGGTLNPPPIFLAAGGMEMLIDMMHGSKDEFTQAQGAGAVFEACFNNPSNQKALANATGQGLHAMVALLRSGTPDLQSKAAQAIAAACGSNEANRAAVVLAGGIEALVRLLGGSNTAAMENAANALANVIKQRAGVGESLPGARQAELEGLRQLRVHGGIQALMAAMKGGTPRVKEAATAAVANAMEFCNDTRKAFQEAGGIRVVLDVLQSADPHAQENATTALWNSMVDNEDACTQVVQLGGIPILVQQVMAGTEVGQELAAGAIWKACASDPSVKDEVRMAIPGLVQLVATGTQGAKEHAAGALRSACINSAQNKEELNKCGGVEALIGLIRDGNPRAGEQAGAALANALANCEANQIAAANAGGMEVLLSVLDQEHDKTSEIVSGCVSVLRNMCAGNRLRQEKLGQLGGVKKLVACVPGNIEDMNSRSMVLTSYLLGALWKACTRCEANRETLRAIFMDKLEALKASEFVSSEVRQGALNVLNVLSSPAGSPTGGSPPEPSKST